MTNYKKFLIYFLLFFALTTGVDFLVMEIFTRKILVPNDVINKKEQMIVSGNNDVKIISFGDSHVMYGMNINNSDYFNLAIDSEPVPIWYFKLKWLLKNFSTIDTILLPLDYHIFSSYRTKDVGYLTKQYAKYINEEVDNSLGYYPKPNDARKIKFYSLQVNYSSIVHRTFLDYIFGRLNKPNLLQNGTLVKNGRFLDLTSSERKKKAEKRTSALYKDRLINEGMVEYYDKIIKLAEENKIKVVLIRYPLSNEYLSFITFDLENKFDSLIKNIKLKHNNIMILDYRNVFEKNQEMFNDSDHLNINGATRLGILFLKEFNKYKINFKKINNN